MKWFCLVTQIASEFRALADLEARKFTAYLPRITRITMERGRRCERQRPLLPRYLFLCLPDFQRIEEVHGLIAEVCGLASVVEILPHDFEPRPVPELEVVRLQEREAAGEFRFEATPTGRRRERATRLRSFRELAIVMEGRML